MHTKFQGYYGGWDVSIPLSKRMVWDTGTLVEEPGNKRFKLLHHHQTSAHRSSHKLLHGDKIRFSSTKKSAKF